MTKPIIRSGDIRRTQSPPYKYSDNFYVTNIMRKGENLAVLDVMAKLCTPETAEDPVYAAIELLDLDGFVVIGGYVPPFSMMAIDPDDSAPDAADTDVVRPLVLVRAKNRIDLALLRNDNLGWPRPIQGATIEQKHNIAGNTKNGGSAMDFLIASGASPSVPTNDGRRTNVLLNVKELGADTDDPRTYSIEYTNGKKEQISVAASATQPQVGNVWPTGTVEEGTFNVLDVHQDQMFAYPKRNCFVVPPYSPDPLHNMKLSEGDNDTVVAVSTVRDQASDGTVTEKKLVQLANGKAVRVSSGTSVTVGLPWNNGTQPAADTEVAVELLQSEWWHFRVFLILDRDNAGRSGFNGDAGEADALDLGGLHADVWPLFPNDLTPSSDNAPTIAVAHGAGSTAINDGDTLQVPTGTTMADVEIVITLADADSDTISLQARITNAADSGLDIDEWQQDYTAPGTVSPTTGTVGPEGTVHNIKLHAVDATGVCTEFEFTIEAIAAE